ncbi:GNAT family N-acetyltransferase [Spirosoma sp. KCTC 42546]|uniref:GNAT family N-acetyltransferase n=1 Tax=Spirosoma sp. KCTC 42546 TaxID=2520506 RepID=UPI00115AA1E2|nr:GNAT family N-acetyltransferase [Spirosoma sp. KCTC 42546]QDK81075.1 GNAT family N-acetyltransferase [Spirosoma sp. KCTC 42546]
MSATSKPVTENWNGFRIERSNSSHYLAISKLLNAASRANFNQDSLQKKYATQFLGTDNVGYTAFDDDLAVSHQMGLLVPLLYKGEAYTGVQSCDSATHPDYAKKGLWAVLNDYMFRQLPAEGITGVLGLPNQNSYGIAVNKLGYQVGRIFKNYSITLRHIPVWKVANRIGLGEWISLQAEKSLKRYQCCPEPFNSFDSNEYLTINRTPEFLNYKTKMGSFFISLYDTTFWIKVRGQHLFIGDLKTHSSERFEQAMRKLRSICYWSGLDAIIFQTHEGSFEESLFATYYQGMETMPILYKKFNSNVPYHLFRCTYADLDTF